MSLLKLFYTGREPTHAEIAALELEETRQALLMKERELESAMCAVSVLKAREARLATYVSKNPAAGRTTKLSGEGPIKTLGIAR